MQKDFLFVNAKHSDEYAFFKLEKEWEGCFVVLFTPSEAPFKKLYWGHRNYVAEDRQMISQFLTTAFLPAPTDEWKSVRMERLPKERIEELVRQAKFQIEKM